jgi:hypothetical protein
MLVIFQRKESGTMPEQACPFGAPERAVLASPATALEAVSSR